MLCDATVTLLGINSNVLQTLLINLTVVLCVVVVDVQIRLFNLDRSVVGVVSRCLCLEFKTRTLIIEIGVSASCDPNEGSVMGTSVGMMLGHLRALVLPRLCGERRPR